MNDETGGELPDRSKRIYVLWAAGFAFLGLLAIVCVYFLRPYMEVRAAVRRLEPRFGLNTSDDKLRVFAKDEMRTLGGPEKAAAKCSLYLRCPKWLVTNAESNRASWIFAACGPPALPWAESLLRSRDELVRLTAAWALSEIKDPRAAEPLTAALKDSDTSVRCMAVFALGELKDPRAVEPLIATLKDTEADVRHCAAHALGELKDRRAVEPLKALLADPDKNVRKTAEEAIRRIEASAH